MPYTVAIAGTTERTLMCAQAILTHPELKISFIITPAPKPIGRNQKITKNGVQLFADSNQLPTVLVKNKIDEEVKREIKQCEKPDFLLVIDFGYLVPEWLLDLPKIMPLNIHPSALPKWRGSSPGQFVLLNGESKSAVSVIQMTPKFDQGPIVWQQEFEVNPSWTQAEYYQFSFELVCKELAEIMIKLGSGEITPLPQPDKSPTPLARRITKQDAFREWDEIQSVMKGENVERAAVLEQASRAYSPWPLLWTEIPTNKGKKRMQIISTQIKDQKLILNQVKIEGMGIKPWVEVKNVIKD